VEILFLRCRVGFFFCNSEELGGLGFCGAVLFLELEGEVLFSLSPKVWNIERDMLSRSESECVAFELARGIRRSVVSFACICKRV
jgi:hypothetical protein